MSRRRNVLVFADTGWSIGKVHREVMKYIDCDVKFHYPSTGLSQEEIAQCDCLITTLTCHNYILEIIPPDRRTRNKVLIVCHGFEEIFDGDYCVDFNYSVTSDVLLPLIQKYVKNVKVVPNCVEPSLYTHVERSGELKVVGWAGAPWVWYKRFKMFHPIVEGAGLLGKVTDPVIPVDKMDEWYQDVDILLVLSGPEPFKETGPLPPFEAIVRGIPVIGTAVGNFKHIPGPKFETIEEGVRILTELKNDPARVRQLANEQLECVLANWTYSVVAQKWEDAMFVPSRRKVLVFSEVGFGKLYREVLQRLSRCDVVYYDAACFNIHNFIYDLQQSDACLVPIYLYGDIHHFVQDKSLLSKFLFVAHDSSHIHALQYSLDARYAVVSDSILHKMQQHVQSVYNIPSEVDPSLYTYRRRSGMLNIVGWSGRSKSSIARSEMFHSIVDGVDLAGKATSGRIPVDKMNEWYQNVDILLVLSGPEVETGPLSAFEAIACGIPVVGTTVGNFRHIPGPKFSTVEEGIALLEQLKRDPDMVRDIAKQQYEAVMSRWSYDVTAKLWEEALFGKNQLDGNS